MTAKYVKTVGTLRDYRVILDNVKIGRFSLDMETGILYNVNIKEEFRGKGFGRRFMQDVEHKAKSLRFKSLALMVNFHNAPALRMYHRAGFNIVGIRYDMFFLMRKNIGVEELIQGL